LFLVAHAEEDYEVRTVRLYLNIPSMFFHTHSIIGLGLSTRIIIIEIGWPVAASGRWGVEGGGWWLVEVGGWAGGGRQAEPSAITRPPSSIQVYYPGPSSPKSKRDEPQSMISFGYQFLANTNHSIHELRNCFISSNAESWCLHQLCEIRHVIANSTTLQYPPPSLFLLIPLHHPRITIWQ
jgi:hypothetical protein